MKHFIPFLLALFALSASAQKYCVKGTVVDKLTAEALPEATVVLQSPDSVTVVHPQTREHRKYATNLSTTTTSDTGEFSFNSGKGKFVVRIELTGFHPLTRHVEVTKENPVVDLGKVELASTDILLNEAQVTALARMMSVKADTLIFHTKALRLPPGASLATLMSQLPGISVDQSGNLTFQGKTVNQVLVDGKPFFGDVRTALENMPVDAIKDVKMYEKTDEEKEFRGELDTEKATVVDLAIKDEYKSTWMTNMALGGGTNERYVGRLFTTNFTDRRRTAVFAQVNNISQDQRVDGNGNWSFSSSGDGFYTYRKAGTMLQWDNGKGNKDAGNWRSNVNIDLKHNDQNSIRTYNREALLGAGNSQFSYSKSVQKSHDAEMKFRGSTTYNFDAQNRVTLNGEYWYRENPSNTSSATSVYHELPEYSESLAESLWRSDLTEDVMRKAVYAGRSVYDQDYDTHHMSVGGGYTHIFKKSRRTFNAMFDARYHNSKSAYDNLSNYLYFNPDAPQPSLFSRQHEDAPNTSYNIQSTLQYSHPLSKNLTLNLHYLFSYGKDDKRKDLFDAHPIPVGMRPTLGDSIEFVRDLENSYNYDAYRSTNNVTIDLDGYYGNFEFSMQSGISYYTDELKYLRGEQRFLPKRHEWAPSLTASVQYKFSAQNYVRLGYSGYAHRQPIIYLVPVTDTSNPMFEMTNNPLLKKEWQDNFDFFGRYFNAKRGDSYSLYGSFSTFRNATVTTEQRDPVTGYGRYGMTQVNGNYAGRIHFNTEQPLDQQRQWVLSAYAGVYTAHETGYVGAIVDGQGNVSNANGLSVINTLNPSARVKLNFRKSRWSVSMQAKYDNNNVTYKQAPQYNQHGHIYEVRLDPQVDFPFGMRINSSLIYYGRRGYADELLNHDQWLVNATVSQSFLKNKALTLQFEVVDLLKQRTSEESRFTYSSRTFSRTETFLSYMMLHAIYKFNIGGNK